MSVSCAKMRAKGYSAASLSCLHCSNYLFKFLLVEAKVPPLAVLEKRRNAFGTAHSCCYRQNLSNPVKSPLLLKFQDLHCDDVAQQEKLRKESKLQKKKLPIDGIIF